MRKSVMIGFGLWLLAVASVAAIAWLAIDTAGRQVTSVAVTAAMPGSGGSAKPSNPPVAAPDRSRTSSPASQPRRSTRSQYPSGRAQAGTFATDGGSVHAACTSQRATLNGGYARPEPGWTVSVVSRDRNLRVVFSSASRAITILATCDHGRPAFVQRSQSLAGGAQVPQPGPPTQDASVVTPSSPPSAWQPLAQPAGPPVTGTAPDRATVVAYVGKLIEACNDASWATTWCHGWAGLSEQERYALVWHWLTSPNGGSDPGAGWDGRP